MSSLEQHLLSSQGSSQYHYDQEQMMPSSPMGPPPSSITSSKPKKAPSVTPRRFTRFFTPSSLLNTNSRSGTSRSAKQLRDITRNANNRKTLDTVPPPKLDGFENAHFQTPRKKRRILATPDTSPLQPISSPCRPGDYAPLDPIYHDHTYDSSCASVNGDAAEEEEQEQAPKPFPRPIRRLPHNPTASRILQRSFGGSRVLSRGRSTDHCSAWQSHTASFYSSPDDCHSFRGAALPFCVTPCHSNSLVAIGDEEGGIRLVDSAIAPDLSFATPHVSFRPHHNAVMDIAFSSDDFLFATASGDQTGRIVDMRTQQIRYTMHGHMSSVKQVRFQPDNDMIVATSSRDGSVKIWDLRCSGTEAPAADFSVAFEPGNDLLSRPTVSHTVRYAEPVNFFKDAHSYTPKSLLNTDSIASSGPRDAYASSRTNSSSNLPRRTDVSITALSFLPDSRSHLLLTASEANATIKLWDIRGKHTFRSTKDSSKPSVPISSTTSPTTHIRNRHFGINSLAMSSDGSRFYALCRDSTVYAYSTNHLILGQAPEYDSPSTTSKWGRPAPEKRGLGPLYGFRHEQFRATSFYVKAAVRPAKRDQAELLAVGSRDGCAVVFPTDEAFLSKPSLQHAAGQDDEPEDEEDEDDGLPTLASLRKRQSSLVKARSPDDEGIPIYEQGTPLVRGHTSEVTSLSWTHEGELVTLSDDFVARRWSEDDSKARELRQGGEVNGQRWNCGWADVPASWDEES